MDQEFKDFVINKINTLNNLLTTPISFNEPLEDMEKDILLGNLTLVENAYHAQLILDALPEPPEPEEEEPDPIISPVTDSDFRGPNPIYINPKTFVIDIYGPIINELNFKDQDYIILLYDDNYDVYIVKWKNKDPLLKDGKTPNAEFIEKIDHHHYRFKSQRLVEALELDEEAPPIINAKHYGYKFDLHYTSFKNRGCLTFSTRI